MTGPPEQSRPYTFDRVVRLVLSAVTLIALFALLRYLSDVLLPFAAAVILAYLLNPLVTAVERRTRRRGPAVALTLCGLGIVGLALVAVLIPLTFSQISRFRDDVMKLRADLSESLEAEPDDAGTPGATPKTDPSKVTPPSGKSTIGWRELKAGWTAFRRDAASTPRAERLRRFREHLTGTYLGHALGRAVEYTKSEEFDRLLVDAAKRVAAGGWTVVTFAVNVVLGLTGLIVVLLYLVFLLLDYREYARTWRSFLPPDYRDSIVDFVRQFDTAMRRYFRGQSVVALLTAALSALGFTLIGLPMALLLGLFVGLLNMVPYLQAVALVPALGLASIRAIEGDASFTASVLLTLAVFAVVQVIQDAIITPRIMGQATGLRPVAILLGVFIWGKLLGFLGLLLAIPLTCLGIAYYRRYVLEGVGIAGSTVPAADPPQKRRHKGETRK